ncbi:MAG: cysteine synthase family protein [Deltaproteobacteria bacterium]|jgi:cysteine synthase B|nr:cysteine synthase family protein [Deltaproteobacteria bacterium]
MSLSIKAEPGVTGLWRPQEPHARDDGVLGLVGNTPLLAMDKLTGTSSPVRIYAKAEYLNPSGSVKDRAAKGMLLDGIRTGRLSPDKTIIDATSGNTGIAYAMLGAALGYKVLLYIPANANRERKGLIRAYGATIVETDPLEGSDGAFLAAQAEYQGRPELYFFPDQYNNHVNPRTHYETTGAEILEQTGGGITHFVSSLGTSGTFMGTARRLKESDPRVKCVAIQPDSPMHGIEGTKHMASTIRPGIYRPDLIDSEVLVTTDEAYRIARYLARSMGILAGISSGANLAGAIKLSRALPRGSVVVTVLGDSGTRYLSDGVFGEAG